MQIRRVGDVRCQVGEGPLWDGADGTLWFVDIVGQCLWAHRPVDGSFTSYAMPQPIAAASRDTASGIVVALADGFHRLDPATGAVTPLAAIDLPSGTQLNDGKVDQHGRFVVAGADKAMRDPIGVLHRLDPDGTVAEIDRGFAIGNGPCWSPDGGTFYCADSIAKRIYAYAYDQATGTASQRRVFADTAPLGGIPDGATVDAAGDLWMAMCGAGKVVRFSPEGTLCETIEMPTAWVSSVMFGGTELDCLYVTSIDPMVVGIPGDDGCGYLYAIDGLSARGLTEPRVHLNVAA